MKSKLDLPVLGAVFLIWLPVTPCVAADHAIEDVMKTVMKGGDSTFKKVSSGKGSDADAKKLLEYLNALPGNKPPKGDAASWKSKTSKLVQAAGDVVAKKPGAVEALKSAGDCKGCHVTHRKLLGF
jgi:hypothetical protein